MAIQRAAEETTVPPVFSLNPAMAFRAGGKTMNSADKVACRPRPRMIARKGRAARISSPPPAAQGSLPIRRQGQGLFVCYKWPLVVGGVLLFAAIGAYAMARTLTHNRFGD